MLRSVQNGVMGDHALIFSCIGSESAQHANSGSSPATSGFGLNSNFLHLMSDANNFQSVNYKTAINIGFCHPLYRTKPCRKYHYTGICEFGNNCFYLHPGMVSQPTMRPMHRGDGWIDYSYGQSFVPMENGLSSCMNTVGFPFLEQQPTTSNFENLQSPHEDLNSPIESLEQTEYQEDELDAMDFDSVDEISFFVDSVTSEESSCFEGTVENVVFSALPKEDDDKTPWASATAIGSSLNSDDSRAKTFKHRRLPRVLHHSINFSYPMQSNNSDLFSSTYQAKRGRKMKTNSVSEFGHHEMALQIIEGTNELIKQYFQSYRYYNTLAGNDREEQYERDFRVQVDRIVSGIVKFMETYDIDSLILIWEFFNTKLFNNMDEVKALLRGCCTPDLV
ncbi:Zinc finger protein 36 C3H1 type-like 1 [Aphelenchoides besseyi]|nr:Zinc finger protein 36 C3H1 type-like 1 [Aphelenchoides besseyi]